SNTQRDKPGSPPPTVTVAEIHAEPISLSGKSRKRSHSVYSDKEERNDDVNMCRFINYGIITELVFRVPPLKAIQAASRYKN
ncbi:Uncharacterized protein APZ42_009230, partial [Daphnia magna]